MSLSTARVLLGRSARPARLALLVVLLVALVGGTIAASGCRYRSPRNRRPESPPCRVSPDPPSSPSTGTVPRPSSPSPRPSPPIAQEPRAEIDAGPRASDASASVAPASDSATAAYKAWKRRTDVERVVDSSLASNRTGLRKCFPVDAVLDAKARIRVHPSGYVVDAEIEGNLDESARACLVRQLSEIQMSSVAGGGAALTIERTLRLR